MIPWAAGYETGPAVRPLLTPDFQVAAQLSYILS